VHLSDLPIRDRGGWTGLGRRDRQGGGGRDRRQARLEPPTASADADHRRLPARDTRLRRATPFVETWLEAALRERYPQAAVAERSELADMFPIEPLTL
jgi:hypothetical protein